MIEESEHGSDQEKQEKLENKRKGKREREEVTEQDDIHTTEKQSREKQSKNKESKIESSEAKWEPEDTTKNSKEKEKEKSSPIDIDIDNLVSSFTLLEPSEITKKNCRILQEATDAVNRSQNKKVYSLMVSEYFKPTINVEKELAESFTNNMQSGLLTHTLLYSTNLSFSQEDSNSFIATPALRLPESKVIQNQTSPTTQPVENKSSTTPESSRPSSSSAQMPSMLNTSMLTNPTSTSRRTTGPTREVVANPQTQINMDFYTLQQMPSVTIPAPIPQATTRPTRTVAATRQRPIRTRSSVYDQNTATVTLVLTPAPPLVIQHSSSSSTSSIQTSQSLTEAKDWNDLRDKISKAHQAKNANSLDQLATQFLKSDWKGDILKREVTDGIGITNTYVVVPQKDTLFLLADSYKSGSVVSKNPAMALQIVDKLAEHGHPHAQYVLGKGFIQGDTELDITINYSSGIKNLQEAANKNHALALELLGNCHEYGIGVKPAPWTALSCYRAALMLDDGGWDPQMTKQGVSQKQAQEKEQEQEQPQQKFSIRVNASVTRVTDKIKQQEEAEQQKSKSKSPAASRQPDARSESTSSTSIPTISTSSSSSSTSNKVAVGQNIYSQFNPQNRDKPASSANGITFNR